MAVANARQATQIAAEYVEDVLRRDDLVIDEVVEEGGEWVIVLEGLDHDYKLRINADQGEIIEFRRLDGEEEDEEDGED